MKANELANYLIFRAAKEGVDLSPMKLQKLMYFAHGWYTAIYEKPLIEGELFEAWKFGPVLPSIYNRFKDYGAESIAEFANFSEHGADAISNQTVLTVLDKVWSSYSKLSASKLSDLTHEITSPWYIKVMERGGLEMLGKGVVIDNEAISNYFRSQIPTTA